MTFYCKMLVLLRLLWLYQLLIRPSRETMVMIARSFYRTYPVYIYSYFYQNQFTWGISSESLGFFDATWGFSAQ